MTLEAYDIGNDVLLVQQKDEEGNVIAEARGWVSATTNFFEPKDYDEDKHIKKEAKGRKMKDPELRAYCAELIDNVLKADESVEEKKVKIL